MCTYCGELRACYQWTTALTVAIGIATKLGSTSRHFELLPSASSRLPSDDVYSGIQSRLPRRRAVENPTHYERTWLSADIVSDRPDFSYFQALTVREIFKS